MLSNESNVEWTNSSGTILEDLEIVMATSIWDTMLNDPNMTFTNNNGTKECAGLVVSEEEETVTNDDANTDFQTDNSGTNLLGLTIYPADVVNPDGKFMTMYTSFAFFRITCFSLSVYLVTRVHQPI